MTWLGYTRVSRVGDRGDRLISPELQAERIRSYAAAHGHEVEILDPELDVSGGKMERPILNAAIERIESDEAAGIIVAQLDRLSRAGIVDTLKVIERIEAAGGEVIAVAENFDDSTPEGRMGRNVMLSLGEMQLDRYKAQFASAKRQAVERGIWPTPTPPIGYRLGKDRHLEPDPKAAALVVKAFEARAAGGSQADVARILGRGRSAAMKVIRNPAYLGELHLGEWVNRDAHEPIIVERSLWEAAQLDHPRPARGIHGQALLAGLVRCGGCQRVMTPDQSKAQRCYRCRTLDCPAPAWISQQPLDPYVEEKVLAALRMHVKPHPRTDDVAEVERSLVAAEAELASFQDATRVAEVGPEHFGRGLRSRVDAVEAARERLGRTRANGTSPGLVDALDAYEELSVAERRAVLAAELAVVWVRRGRASVAERVRLVARGQEPPDLSRSGRRASRPSPVVWDDLPAEVGATAGEDLS